MTERRITTSNLAHYLPTAIGFDTIAHAVSNIGQTFPPYNLVKLSETEYELSLAVTGFSRKDITVSTKDRQITIVGKIVPSTDNEAQVEYIHRGLALRDWDKTYSLAEYVEVANVNLADGLLVIKLIRNVPESAKPKVFEIK